jgi:hypothetical protein
MDICVGEGLGRSKAECQGGIVYIGAEEAAALSDWKLLYVARHLDEVDLKMQVWKTFEMQVWKTPHMLTYAHVCSRMLTYADCRQVISCTTACGR